MKERPKQIEVRRIGKRDKHESGRERKFALFQSLKNREAGRAA